LSEPSKDRIVNLLREAVCSGYFSPGMRLIEAELAEKMKVSRVPLREAIRRLEAEGLVEIIPNKGAIVVSHSRDDIKDIYRIWSALEGLAASMAVENLSQSEIDEAKVIQRKLETRELQAERQEWFLTDREFHATLLRGCQRPRLLKLIKLQINQISRYWLILGLIPGIVDKVISEHRKIIDALDSRNSDLICRMAEDHIFSTGLLLADHLEFFWPMVFQNS
jgi:DNA-binding GntR family transcriptional regulator